MQAGLKLQDSSSEFLSFNLKLETGILERAVAAIHNRWNCEATTAVILGSGLGDLAEEVEIEAILDCRDIPGFAHSTALAHKGRLVCGKLHSRPILMLQGRCHLYEGHSLKRIAFPTRVLGALGI